MTVEFWKSLFDVVTVVALFLTFAMGAGSLITGGIINARQKTQLQKAEKTLLELSKRQGNRYIKDHSVSEALKGKPTGNIAIWYQPDDPEAYYFATQIGDELLAGGWKVSVPQPIPKDVSFASFMPPEYHFAGVEKFDQLVPPAVRISGGNGELTILSNAPDKNEPNSTITILTRALKPLVFANFGWRPAATLPDNEFILIVGPKP